MLIVGVRQFREELSRYLDSSEPVHVTRNGQAVGVFIPEEPKKPFDRERFLMSAGAVAAAMDRAGVTEDDIIRDFDELRKAARAQSIPRS